MLSEICLYLKNWFNFGQPKYFGEFVIEDGVLVSRNDGDMGIQEGQYYRIVGSVFNDGVYKRGEEHLKDESFNGAVWLMAVPPDVVNLAQDISDWQNKYGSPDSENMSPFQSESFGGYSYSKGSTGAAGSGTAWQSMFSDRLGRYRKI